MIENFYEVKQLNPWAMIVSFKGYVNGLKDSSVPMSEQENKQMALKWAKENMEKLKEKWNTIIKEGRHVWTIMLKSQASNSVLEQKSSHSSFWKSRSADRTSILIKKNGEILDNVIEKRSWNIKQRKNLNLKKLVQSSNIAELESHLVLDSKHKSEPIVIDFIGIQKEYGLEMKEIIWLNLEFQSMLDITERLAKLQ